ncbi:MAG TPA: ABC transporter substrate-binding protein [Solirubrobacteraceae bacterium]|jgi:putative hydroxymethylpyrimidine transport system substrate-binding protein
MTRRIALLAALAALAAGLVGCGEKDEPATGAAPAAKLEPFTVVLDYFPNADHAGIYAAQASGEYKRAGLDVRIQPPPDPAAPLKLVQAKRADLAITYEPELLLARDAGATGLVSVGALVQKPLTSLMSVGKKAIGSAGELAGKRVGTAGIPYQSAYLRTILEAAGVDPASVKETSVGFNLVPAMLSGKVDATLGAFWNYEGIQLQQAKRDPKILRVDELGVPTYSELVMAVRRESLDQRGASRVRRFVQATARGHQRLREDPAAGIDALLAANSELDRKLQEAAVKATLPVFFPADASKPFGYQDTDEWRRYGEWMRSKGLVKRPPNANRALTNEFLAGQGLEPAD